MTSRIHVLNITNQLQCYRFLDDLQQNKIMAEIMNEAIEINHELLPCNICGRTFLPAPLKKHYKVCEKSSIKRRKPFNSLKQRVEGTDLALFHQQSYLRKAENPVQATPPTVASLNEAKTKRNQSNWKEKHEELVQAIRAAKGEKLMAPRRSITSVGMMGTTERCPTCERHFGPKAYDRHVEWCKEHKYRAPKSPANVLIAKERLEARTKYRVPPLSKSKRSVTREKYAPPGHRTDSLVNVRSTSSLEQTNLERNASVRKPKIKQNTVAVSVSSNVPSVSEPVIKGKAPAVEKMKSSNFKYRIYSLLKTNSNDPKVNEIPFETPVPPVNFTALPGTKLITWKDTNKKSTNDETVAKKTLPFTINIINSENISSTNNDFSNIHDKIFGHKDDKTNEENCKISSKGFYLNSNIKNDTSEKNDICIEEKDSYEIVTIKKPVSNHTSNTDNSLCSDLEVKPSEETIVLDNEETIVLDSTVELNNNSSKSVKKIQREPDESDTKCSFRNISAAKVWDLAETELLNSLKSNSKLSKVAFNHPQITSTPLPVKISENLESNNVTCNVQLLNNEEDNLFTFEASPILNTTEDTNCNAPVNIETISTTTSIVEFLPKERMDYYNESVSASDSDISQNYDSSENCVEFISIINNEYKNNNKEVVVDNKRKANHIKSRNYLKNNQRQLETGDKMNCDLKDLDKFLKEKRSKSRLEVEIIASEACDDEDETTSLNLYRVNSSEMILRGDNCLDTLNKSFSRNKIKHVNIVFVNEDTNDKKRVIFESELKIRHNNKSRVKSKIRKNGYSKYSRKQRRSVVYIPHDHVSPNDKRIPNLPFIKKEPYSELKRKPDNFWQKYTQSKNESDELNETLFYEQYSKALPNNVPTNLKLPPINLNNDNSRKTNSPRYHSPTRLPPIIEEKHVSFGKNSAIKDVDYKKQPLSPLKRSVSLSNPVVKARSMKNKQDIQDYLHVRETKPTKARERETVKERSPRFSENLFPVGHEMYEEYKKYEEQYKEECLNIITDDQKASGDIDNYESSSIEENHSHIEGKQQEEKLSSDSAYGSLNRLSPKLYPKSSGRRGQAFQVQQTTIEHSPSSSGSETSFPVPIKAVTNQRLTKFCHECGTKYPLDSAKFCVECGLKRLVL